MKKSFMDRVQSYQKKPFKPVVQKGRSLMFINNLLAKKKVVYSLIAGVDIFFLAVWIFLIHNINKAKLSLTGSSLYVNGYGGIIIAYLIFFAVLAIGDLILYFKIQIAFAPETINVGQKGTTRKTTKEEIKQQYKEIDLRDVKYDGHPGTLISEFDGKCYIDTSFTNNLYIGITRSGKDETAVFRNTEIYSRAEILPSIIYFDPKAESYKSSKQELINRGYDVYFMNLENPELSMGFNPLQLIVETQQMGDFTHAEDLANSLSYSIFQPDEATGNEKFFVQSACNLFVAAIMAMVKDAIQEDENVNKKRKQRYEAKVEKFNRLSDEEKDEVRKEWQEYQKNGIDMILNYDVPYIPDDIPFTETNEYTSKVSIYSILMLFMQLKEQKITAIDPVTGQEYYTGETMYDLYFKNRPDNDRAKFKYFTISANKSEKTIGNIYSTMLTKLTIFSYTSVAKMTAESSIDLKQIGFGEKPIAVFIGAPDYDKSKHVLASIFVRQVYFANAQGCWNRGTCQRPIRIVANEIGNFPAIEALDSMATVGAGRHITFDFYIQSEEQLKDIYKGKARIIMNNCANKFFILSDDEETCKNFSRSIGNETVTDVDRTGGKFSLNKHFMERSLEKPLISETQLQELQVGENVIKRSVKRRDNEGNDITPTPILNLMEDGFRISSRYEILEDIFPSPSNIDLRDVNTESRQHINLEERMWDAEITFRQISEEKHKTQKKKEIITVGELPENISRAVGKIFDEMDTDKTLDVNSLNVVEAKKMIQDDKYIKPYQKKAIITAIDSYISQQK